MSLNKKVEIDKGGGGEGNRLISNRFKGISRQRTITNKLFLRSKEWSFQRGIGSLYTYR